MSDRVAKRRKSRPVDSRLFCLQFSFSSRLSKFSGGTIMEHTNQSFLATEKIGVLMRKYTIPCIISLLVGALYNIVDQIFIANADYLGSYGNAANTVVFPLTVIALAIAVMIGDGCCAFVSLSLGKKRPGDAGNSVGNAIVLTIAVFIFVFRWGMTGAAAATVFGQIVTAILAVRYLRHTKTVQLKKAAFHLHPDIIKHMLTLGICSFLSQISLVAAMAAINNMVRRYSTLDAVFSQEQYAQIPMAVVGIVMKFFQIVISIVVGMAAGCIPIVGFNIGAGQKTRVKNLFTKLLICEAIVGAAAFFIAELMPGQLIAIFGAANESTYYTDFAIKAFRIYLCMVILACINKATFIFLQAMGKAIASTVLSMIREIVFGVGFALLLPGFFGLDGVLYSMPVSDVLTAIFSAAIIFFTYRELSV